MNLKLIIPQIADWKKAEGHYKNETKKIFTMISNDKTLYEQYLGWIDWPLKDHTAVLAKMKAKKEEWKNMGIKKIVIIGIGGSYIGAKALIDFCKMPFTNSLFDLIFVPNMSANYIAGLIENLKEEKFAIVVISKSGTTLEPAVGFRLLRTLLYKNYPAEAQKLIVTITDKAKGVLFNIANLNKYTSFVIEDNIGGRFSTITPVGLFPCVLAGLDPVAILMGAKKAHDEFFNGDFENNSAIQYAAMRHFLFSKKHLSIEGFCTYDPDMNGMVEQAKQILAESDGKNENGLMPILLSFTTDLHSVGQLIQEGKKSFFLTTLFVQEPKFNLKIEPSIFKNDDQLDWLVNKSIHDINNAAFDGTFEAHSQDGGVINFKVLLANWQPEMAGYFYYWLSIIAMFTSYFANVHPFTQPGVEAYKKRMFTKLKQ